MLNFGRSRSVVGLSAATTPHISATTPHPVLHYSIVTIDTKPLPQAGSSSRNIKDNLIHGILASGHDDYLR